MTSCRLTVTKEVVRLRLTQAWGREKKMFCNAFFYFSYKQHCKKEAGMHTQLSITCAILRAVMRNSNSFFSGITTTFVRNWGEGLLVGKRGNAVCWPIWDCSVGAVLGILSRNVSKRREKRKVTNSIPMFLRREPWRVLFRIASCVNYVAYNVKKAANKCAALELRHSGPAKSSLKPFTVALPYVMQARFSSHCSCQQSSPGDKVAC